MMETMPELGGFRRHDEAGAKQTKWEAYSGGTLLELSLYVLQGCSWLLGTGIRTTCDVTSSSSVVPLVLMLECHFVPLTAPRFEVNITYSISRSIGPYCTRVLMSVIT